MPKFENIGEWVEKRFGGQAKAAKAMGVSQGVISDWINGQSVPRPDKQAKMIKFDYDGPLPAAKKKGGVNREDFAVLKDRVKTLRDDLEEEKRKVFALQGAIRQLAKAANLPHLEEQIK